MQAELRNTPKEQFKQLAKFKDLHEKGKLYSPTYVAKIIYNLDKKGELTNGRILDIRNL